MRKYEQTHPWIKFAADLARASPELWMLLGEACSKCEHLAGVPLRPQTAKDMHIVNLAKGALATTAIEGNTLSEEQVNQLLRKELRLPRSKQYLAQEVQNIVDAVNALFDERIKSTDGLRLSLERLLKHNASVLRGLEVAEHVRPGELRDYSVGVALYRGAPPEDLEFLMRRLCEWLNDSQFEPNEQYGIAPALLRAVLAHLYLAWIHPFGDGNGRTARLLEFEILVSAGVPTPAAHLLSNHYNETRAEYYRQLDQASRSGGDVVPFINYAMRGFVDQLREQIEKVRAEQLDVAWRNYVHEGFRGANGAKQRQRDLVLDLSRHRGPLSRADILNVSPRMAREYANKTPKTLTRDLNELVARNLIVLDAEGYRANVDVIKAFVPKRRPVAGAPKREAPAAIKKPRDSR